MVRLCVEDLALDYDIVAESFETSVPWDRALALCRNVKRRVADDCARAALTQFLICCRLTQTFVYIPFFIILYTSKTRDSRTSARNGSKAFYTVGTNLNGYLGRVGRCKTV